MPDLESAKLLLEASKRDALALSGMEDSSIFADEIFGFHAHQAVEKALKAWIAAVGGTFPRTHDLTLLVSILATLGEEFDPKWDIVWLNPFAVQLRYEAFDSDEEPIDRVRALRLVAAIVAAAENKVQEAEENQP